jgi:hypothetical protein
MDSLYHAVGGVMKMVVNCVQGQGVIVTTSETAQNPVSNTLVSDPAGFIEFQNTALQNTNESTPTLVPLSIDPDKLKLQVNKGTQTEDSGTICPVHTGSIKQFPPTPWRDEAQIDISRLPLASRTYAVAAKDPNGKNFLAVTVSKRAIDFWNSLFSCEKILDDYGIRLEEVDREESVLRAQLKKILNGGEDEMPGIGTGGVASIGKLCLQEKLADLAGERARYIKIRQRKLREHNRSLDNLGFMWQDLLEGDLIHLNRVRNNVEHDLDFKNQALEGESMEKFPPTRSRQDVPTLGNVLQNVYDKRLKLQEAQDSVDNIRNFYKEELAEYQACVAAEKTGLSRSNFDKIMLINARDTTRRLITAEKELKDAQETARRLGAFCDDSEQESGFQDFLDDGYRISEEEKAISSLDRAAIERWLTIGDVEYDADPDEPNLDVKTVGISDSISVLAEGSKRRRIDRWRLECQELENRVGNS